MRLLCLLAVACSAPPTAAPAVVEPAADGADRPDLALLLVAGLRADAPGRPGAEAAFLDGLGQPPSQRFSAAYAQSPSSYASLGAVLTGRYVGAIPLCGLQLDAGGEHLASTQAWCATPPPEVPTLPGVLALYGYRTGLVDLGQPWTEPWASAFESVEHVDPADLVAAAGAWWRRDDARPRLLVVVGEDVAQRALPAIRTQQGASDGEAREEAARRLYAERAGGIGRALAPLLGALEQGSAERVLVASLGGFNLLETSAFATEPAFPMTAGLVLDRTVHVPLASFSSGPQAQSEVVDDVVQLADLLPTLLGQAGAVLPAGLAGTDLAAHGQGLAYTEFGDMLGLREGPWFLGYRGMVHGASSLDPELDRRMRDPACYTLHDVLRDPEQRTDLRQSEAARFEQLRARMVELRSTRASPGDALTAGRLWELRMTPTEGYW